MIAKERGQIGNLVHIRDTGCITAHAAPDESTHTLGLSIRPGSRVAGDRSFEFLPVLMRFTISPRCSNNRARSRSRPGSSVGVPKTRS